MKKLTAFIALALTISLTACKQENETMPDAVQSNLGISSSYNMIMETENGYYYNSGNFGSLSLRYLDKKTGKDIFLCAKPECLHDGSRFCPATNSSFDVLYTAMYEDAVYIAVQCPEDEDRYTMKLLRATQNGTELSEVCTYIKGNGELTPQIITNESKQMVIHRGYAFVPYRLYSGADQVSKTGAYIIDINSGKYDKICEYGTDETDGVRNITAQGDSFYYTLKIGSGGTDELYRCDIGTKKPQPLGLYDSYKSSFGYNFAITDYTVIDGKVWYTKYSAGTYDPYSNVFIFDPETGETTDNTEFTLYDETFDVDGESYSMTRGIINGGITFDGEYLYLADNGFSSHPGNAAVRVGDPNCTIFSLDGERLGKCVYEDCDAESYAVNIAFGKIYLQTEDNVQCCRVSDVIAGEYEWSEVFNYE